MITHQHKNNESSQISKQEEYKVQRMKPESNQVQGKCLCESLLQERRDQNDRYTCCKLVAGGSRFGYLLIWSLEGCFVERVESDSLFVAERLELRAIRAPDFVEKRFCALDCALAEYEIAQSIREREENREEPEQ